MKNFGLTLGVLCMVMLMLVSGCAGGGKPKAAARPNLSIAIRQVDQFAKLGAKIADGQYVVAQLTIQNLTNKTMTISPSEFTVRNVTDDPEERYSQSPEVAMFKHLSKEYDLTLEQRDKILEGIPTNAHPRIEMERYIVFLLPSKADLRKYELVYTPSNKQYPEVAVPLGGEGTRINDNRSEY